MNGNSNAYTRPGTAYLALRAILGKDNYNARLHHIQMAYRGGSITEEQLETEFHKYMPNQSIGCSQQARRVLQAVVGHAVHGLARRPATSRRSRARAWPAAASMTPTAAARTTAPTSPARPAARCPRRWR